MEKLPGNLGDWQAAELTLTAVAAGSTKPIKFNLFGIGVGKRAVGSTGIYQVTLGPETVRDEELASWGYRSRHDFERSQIVLYHQIENQWKVNRTLNSPCRPRRRKRCEGQWVGLNGGNKRLAGKYRIGVKAWQSSQERDWIIEFSDKEVEVLP